MIIPQKQRMAILLRLCAAGAARNGVPTRDLTAPDPEALGLEVAVQFAPNTWTTKRSTLTARTNAQAGTIDSFTYVVGGTAASVPRRRLESYSVLRNTWSEPLPASSSSSLALCFRRRYSRRFPVPCGSHVSRPTPVR
jgi:hypothetical protein